MDRPSWVAGPSRCSASCRRGGKWPIWCGRAAPVDTATFVAVGSVRQMSQRRHQPDRLTRREREIVNAIFALGNRASAEEIRARLSHPPTDSSVRVMLARLERKGVLKHDVAGPK